MKSIIQLATLSLLAVATLASCNKHDDKTLDSWNGEIRLTSGITAQTRAGSDVPDQQIAAGKIVSFFVDDAGTKAQLYEDYGMTANGSGGFTKNNPNEKDMFYPATGNNVDIYAFLTDGFVGAPAFPTSAIIHEVKSDQSIQHGDNYLASDLLYAASKGVVRSPKAVTMNFYHMLSKVEVALKAGVGAPDLTGAVVTIENTQLKADFLPLKSAAINSTTAEAQAARAGMVTLTTADNPATPIKIGAAVSDDFSAYASAVVVPQTVATGKRFIKVTLASGGELYYTIPDADGLKLESGNKYQFHITVNLSGLTVKSTVADWATNMPIGGIAEMPVPIGSKSAEQAAIGDFYFSDGSLEDKYATLTQQQHAACIGIVFWKDPANQGKGKFVSVAEATGKEWSMEQAITGANSMTDGRANMTTIAQYIADNGKSWDDYPAFKWAAQLNGKPDGGWDAATDRWYLPAKEELKALYGDFSNDMAENDAVKVAINSSLTKMGTAQLSNSCYWSSSESGSGPVDFAWVVHFYYGNVYNEYKFDSGNVRAVFAF